MWPAYGGILPCAFFLASAGCQTPVGTICGTIAGIGCPDGMYCAFDEGTCSVADDAGVCMLKPQICTEEFAPVCGCDGMTYGNDCMAASAGVTIASRGECEGMTCGTIAGIGCPDGMYCAFDEGTCQVADRSGQCAPKPDTCVQVFAPVCGCDGMTYSNSCVAAAAGVSLESSNACAGP